MRDTEVFASVERELNRQRNNIELIASENFVSKEIMELAGSVLTNKYAEGYPGKRYYGGCQFVDEVETLAQERLKKLFGCEYANVQPHSGAQANTAVYFALLQPGDKVLGMSLNDGGHLTHGHPLNYSGKTYEFHAYGVDKETERIDYDEYNPETDARIPHNYNQITFRKEKYKNKMDLQQELGLEVNPKKFMVGIVSRLTDQKGFDLIAYVMDELCAEDIQLVILGTGEERYENMFRHFDWKYNNRVSANIYYSEEMSHKIYAACDAYLMPSLFEPCGLSQLMALRYGTVPIVRETGGLRDTVEPYNQYESTGTGFSFRNYNAHEMLNTIRYAEHIYYDRKREWNKIVDRAMATDYSWKVSAGKYQEMYDWLIG